MNLKSEIALLPPESRWLVELQRQLDALDSDTDRAEEQRMASLKNPRAFGQQ